MKHLVIKGVCQQGDNYYDITDYIIDPSLEDIQDCCNEVRGDYAHMAPGDRKRSKNYVMSFECELPEDEFGEVDKKSEDLQEALLAGELEGWSDELTYTPWEELMNGLDEACEGWEEMPTRDDVVNWLEDMNWRAWLNSEEYMEYINAYMKKCSSIY